MSRPGPSTFVWIIAGLTQHACMDSSGGPEPEGHSTNGETDASTCADHVCSDAAVPEDVTGEPTYHGPAVELVAVGANHTCVLLQSGAVRCWGNNEHGQLGYGHTRTVSAAEAGDVSLGEPATGIVASNSVSCAVLRSRKVRCWGRGADGVLGQGKAESVGDDELPSDVPVIALAGQVRHLDLQADSACAALMDGTVRCWGALHHTLADVGGELSIGDDELPTAIAAIEIGGRAIEVGVGGAHVCALTDVGAIRCWGSGWSGALGYGTPTDVRFDQISDLQSVKVGGKAIGLTTSSWGNCVILEEGTARCWGASVYSTLGDGSREKVGDAFPPDSLSPLDAGVPATQAAAGERNVCMLLESGDATCWGNNTHGQVDLPRNTKYTEIPIWKRGARFNPMRLVPLGGTAVQISVGTTHACVVLSTGAVRCWGSNLDGVSGYDSADEFVEQTPEMMGDVPLR